LTDSVNEARLRAMESVHVLDWFKGRPQKCPLSLLLEQEDYLGAHNKKAVRKVQEAASLRAQEEARLRAEEEVANRGTWWMNPSAGENRKAEERARNQEQLVDLMVEVVTVGILAPFAFFIVILRGFSRRLWRF